MKLAPAGAGAMPELDAAGDSQGASEAPVSAVQPVAVGARAARYSRVAVAVAVLAIIAVVAAL